MSLQSGNLKLPKRLSKRIERSVYLNEHKIKNENKQEYR